LGFDSIDPAVVRVRLPARSIRLAKRRATDAPCLLTLQKTAKVIIYHRSRFSPNKVWASETSGEHEMIREQDSSAPGIEVEIVELSWLGGAPFIKLTDGGRYRYMDRLAAEAEIWKLHDVGDDLSANRLELAIETITSAVRGSEAVAAGRD
jgi:hypothetical protein